MLAKLSRRLVRQPLLQRPSVALLNTTTSSTINKNNTIVLFKRTFARQQQQSSSSKKPQTPLSEEEQYEHTIFTVNEQMYRLGRKGLADRCLLLFQDMRQGTFNFPQPNVMTWTTLIQALARNSRHNEAMDLFAEMRERNAPPPNTITWNTVLSETVMHTDECVRIFRMMKQNDDPSPTVLSWNTLLEAYAISDRVDECIDMFHEMVRLNDPAPNRMTWLLMHQVANRYNRLPDVAAQLKLDDQDHQLLGAIDAYKHETREFVRWLLSAADGVKIASTSGMIRAVDHVVQYRVPVPSRVFEHLNNALKQREQCDAKLLLNTDYRHEDFKTALQQVVTALRPFVVADGGDNNNNNNTDGAEDADEVVVYDGPTTLFHLMMSPSADYKQKASPFSGRSRQRGNHFDAFRINDSGKDDMKRMMEKFMKELQEAERHTS